jgi:aminoglycoside phosphotransferase (APT) family kinase protein
LCPKNRPQLEVHFRALGELRARFPDLPVPEPLFAGEVDGVWLTCERRLAGLPAHQHCGDAARMARTLREVSAQLARLVVEPPRPFTDEDFAQQIAARIDRAARFAAVPSTIASLERTKRELHERLTGRPIPRVVYHADLRAKHVQVDEQGGVLGYLDWGTLEPAEIPYLDLLHLVVHERKQEAELTAEQAWRLVQARDALRDHEREALEGYARAVGIDEETRAALELFYPASVAAMAEKNWDYSRPRWLHRQFGV